MLHAAKSSAGPELRVGVVGAGVMGSNHARVLAEMPGVRLAGVADPDRKQAHFVGTTLGCPALSTVD
jgi:UDP-N-acetylglucosamine 3-dehydrogenase